MKHLKLLALFLAIVPFISSCSSDDDSPEIINEEEVITDVTLTFTNSTEGSVTYTYTDPQYRDDSYVAPVISLTSGETYEVETNFYNNSDPEDPELITEEVEEESDDHFLTYGFSDVDIEFTRTDGANSTDSDGVQIGLSTEWVAGTTGTGSVLVSLVHQPTEKITDPEEGAVVGGETDAAVTFDLEIL
ncbi:hypothetical protein SAMN04488096_103336 [Mesonia phycicola]|uniref:Type 1 periplasmic binding fold superfamily protein n=1 Tax=Mesonia phycicola TaxID=579105 RepID=A0A1M6D784_9FLAO|nr:hypothetical protein [Mesonia phycicola]SHI69060.1 hypothetical protein SAMN04488096_103336 [Mesonia phycicola]